MLVGYLEAEHAQEDEEKRKQWVKRVRMSKQKPAEETLARAISDVELWER